MNAVKFTGERDAVEIFFKKMNNFNSDLSSLIIDKAKCDSWTDIFEI